MQVITENRKYLPKSFYSDNQLKVQISAKYNFIFAFNMKPTPK